MYRELADVVEERRPAQPVPIEAREVQLVGDHVGVGPDTLSVTTRQAIVRAEAGRQGDDAFGRLGRFVAPSKLARLINLSVQVAGACGAPSHSQSLRRLAGEQKTH